MNELKMKWEKLEKLEAEINLVKAEIVAALNGALVKAKPVAKRGPKKKTQSADGTVESAEAKRPSLKGVVQAILAKNPDGLELGGIVAEVHGMKERNEYNTNAKSLSAVVSQAVTALKQENVIVHDRESKKYSLPTVAA